jgi:hypothetical protein
VADVAGYSPLMGADEEGTFTTKSRSIVADLFTRAQQGVASQCRSLGWRHHNTATPATTTNGTTAICIRTEPLHAPYLWLAIGWRR